MNIKNSKFIILEVIPTNLKSKNGTIIQLSALKIDSLNLIDRFDYRLCDEKIPIIEMKSLINYDNECFKYVNSQDDILESFKVFIEDCPLLIIDNSYTRDYINIYKNNIYSISDYLDIEYSDEMIEQIINKFNLQNSNHIVDLLYEALMMKYK